MCCFSRAVESVTNTNIFARASDKGRQFLVYSMTLQAAEDLAMVLPLPTPPESDEKAVRFINLEEYPNFFGDLAKGFPLPKPPGRGAPNSLSLEGARPKLEVVSVGAFEASFVPQVADFTRLDERFRLPEGTWQQLPQYRKYGFAVFKLKAGQKKVHPMAFEFPRTNPRQIFFPTVHIHDGQVHDRADFDHTLYGQFSVGLTGRFVWTESPQPAASFVEVRKAAGIVDGEAHVYKRRIVGKEKNTDILV